MKPDSHGLKSIEEQRTIINHEKTEKREREREESFIKKKKKNRREGTKSEKKNEWASKLAISLPRHETSSGSRTSISGKYDWPNCIKPVAIKSPFEKKKKERKFYRCHNSVAASFVPTFYFPE